MLSIELIIEFIYVCECNENVFSKIFKNNPRALFCEKTKNREEFGCGITVLTSAENKQCASRIFKANDIMLTMLRKDKNNRFLGRVLPARLVTGLIAF